MASSFVLVWRVPPPTDRTILARTGNSIFFAGYFKWSNKWFLLANGRSEEIEEPQMWWCEDEYARTHQRDLNEKPPRLVRETLRLRKSKKPEQLRLL